MQNLVYESANEFMECKSLFVQNFSCCQTRGNSKSKMVLGGLGKSSVFTYQATQPSFIFGYRYRHHRCRLNSSVALLTDSHLPTLAVKSSPNSADNTNTNIVVDVVALVPIVVVARRRTAVLRIVDPRPAPQSGSPTPSLLPQPSK